MAGIGLALGSALLFAVATPASKLLLGALSPFQLAGLLYLGAALGTGGSLVARRGAAPARLDPANRARLAGAVALGGIAAPVLLLHGLALSTASSVSLLLNLEIAATAALGAWLFHEPLGARGAAAVVGIAAAGAVVSWGAGWPGLAAAGFVAAACLCWGADNQLTGRIDGMTPARAAFWKGAVAGSTNLAIGLATAPFTASAASAAAALALGALSYGASVALYIAAAQQLGATRAQGIFASAPFLAAGLSFALLGEPLGRAQGLGAALLAISVAALLRARHEHGHEHEALEHVHAHRHDDGHHLHEHAGESASTRHTHWHRHEVQAHAHPHWPDLHHRHGHR
ncbi:MAG TPA: EamA family transporter [Myxococcota bacterium]|nr:EamA family transporter [Myxococcota bacterium]